MPVEDAIEAKTYSERLHKVIPGGAHTYSRGDDQYPSNAPQILERGKGAYVWDPDGNKYLDYGMALRAVTIGYANEEVANAAVEEIWKGNNLTRASMTELEAAELITELIPSVDMVKFAKNGSNVVTGAVKLARGYTGRKYVVRCAEHPFFSFDDWFIGDTVITKGTLEEGRQYTLQFQFNNLQSLEDIFSRHPEDVACVILEPATNLSPCTEDCKDRFKPGGCNDCCKKNMNFLHKVKALCRKYGAVFVLDEMITGFRWHLQGAQTYFDIEPDLSTFGKGMANGFSVAALTGKREIMSQGSILNEGEERLFMMSSTHGAEMSGLGAFIKSIELYKRLNVIDHIWDYGQKLMNGVDSIAKTYGIRDFFYLEGYPCSPYLIAKNKNGVADAPLRTLFIQEMLKYGVLMPYIAQSYSHGETELDMTLNALDKTLKVYKEAMDSDVSKYLNGKPVKPVFRRFN